MLFGRMCPQQEYEEYFDEAGTLFMSVQGIVAAQSLDLICL